MAAAKSPAKKFMNLYEILDLIQAHTFRAAFLSLLIYSIYFARRDSFTVTLCVMCILVMIHMGLDDLMMVWYDKGYTELVTHAWYLFFATTDFMLVFITYSLIDKYKIPMQKASALILMAYITLGFVQVIRYADRIVFKTDVLGGLYTSMIPAINGCLTVSILVYSVGAVWMYRSRRSKEV